MSVNAGCGATGEAVALATAPAPELFTALTLNEYAVPLVNPVNVWLVALEALTQAKPPSLDTS